VGEGRGGAPWGTHERDRVGWAFRRYRGRPACRTVYLEVQGAGPDEWPEAAHQAEHLPRRPPRWAHGGPGAGCPMWQVIRVIHVCPGGLTLPRTSRSRRPGRPPSTSQSCGSRPLAGGPWLTVLPAARRPESACCAAPADRRPGASGAEGGRKPSPTRATTGRHPARGLGRSRFAGAGVPPGLGVKARPGRTGRGCRSAARTRSETYSPLDRPGPTGSSCGREAADSAGPVHPAG